MEGVQDAVRPVGEIVHADGSIYGLIGEVTIILEEQGLVEQSEEFVGRAVLLSSYSEVLELSQDYVVLSQRSDEEQFPRRGGGHHEPEAN